MVLYWFPGVLEKDSFILDQLPLVLEEVLKGSKEVSGPQGVSTLSFSVFHLFLFLFAGLLLLGPVMSWKLDTGNKYWFLTGDGCFQESRGGSSDI